MTIRSFVSVAPVWNVTAKRAGWKLYLGELFGTDKVPYYASPARATDFANVRSFFGE